MPLSCTDLDAWKDYQVGTNVSCSGPHFVAPGSGVVVGNSDGVDTSRDCCRHDISSGAVILFTCVPGARRVDVKVDSPQAGRGRHEKRPNLAARRLFEDCTLDLSTIRIFMPYLDSLVGQIDGGAAK